MEKIKSLLGLKIYVVKMVSEMYYYNCCNKDVFSLDKNVEVIRPNAYLETNKVQLDTQ